MTRLSLLFSFLFQLFFFAGMHAQTTWQAQSAPVSENLISVCFVDTVHGWIASENGDILYTENAGMSWNSLTRIENFLPSKLWFSSTQLGWITGKFAHRADTVSILRSVNGGGAWEVVFDSVEITLNDLFFIDDTMGWTVGWEPSGNDTLSLILHTVDGGDSWIMPMGPRIQDELYSIHFRDLDYGQACGPYGTFFTTNNGGRNELSGWAMNISIASYGKDLYDIFNGGNDYGCAVGESGFILFTKDKWTNHLDYNTTGEDTLLAVTGLKDGTGLWTAGRNGYVAGIQYSFLGLSVYEEDNITPHDLNDIIAMSDHHLWAVGDNGTIMFRGMNLAGIQNNVIQKYFKVYPNPAGDYIRVSSINGKDVHSLSVFTADGRLFPVKQRHVGIYDQILDVSGFREGFYLLKINHETYKITIAR
jgi:photosystem II stability/assembly factor-like uncharacterized protein